MTYFWEGHFQSAKLRAVARFDTDTIAGPWAMTQDEALRGLLNLVLKFANEQNVKLLAAQAARAKAEGELDAVDKLVVEHQAMIQDHVDEIENLKSERDEVLQQNKWLKEATVDGGAYQRLLKENQRLEAALAQVEPNDFAAWRELRDSQLRKIKGLEDQVEELQGRVDQVEKSNKGQLMWENDSLRHIRNEYDKERKELKRRVEQLLIERDQIQTLADEALAAMAKVTGFKVQ